MMRTGLRWAAVTVTPWLLGGWVLVSTTADAGVDASAGYQTLTPTSLPGQVPERLIAGLPASLLAVSPRLSPSRDSALHPLLLADPTAQDDALAAAPKPRGDMKRAAPRFPAVDRSRKGDPAAAVGRDGPASPLAGMGSMILSTRDPRALPPTILMPMTGDAPGPDSVASFEPAPSVEATTPGALASENSPRALASQTTAAARASGATTTGTGSTPTVPRAIALSSTTPAPADATPIEIAAAPVSPEGLAALRAREPAVTVLAKPSMDERPSYASLIDPGNITREERCLAEAVYFEARSEPEDGQAAVAQVVLNRVKSGLYPTSVCGVVYQNRNRHLACQFTFACEGKALRVTEPEAWSTAVRIAREVTYGETYNAEVGGATHYHANYVRPYWAKRLQKKDVIGRHIFYQLRPGQT
ncbi:cell wall hydrolase [Alsobacter sp. SYSU M60028]|uniref:Cell wall hydrolase n=1 Tax=Alsobacter ponti TaxID=2962936 RepID=A0ABT1LAP2_9HYPH|nr:cell wall hydrolase [Alsobacter ponti]MCP8938545.1 cell wall hydrolase [Alsobacter ponti]